jgi:hypothetical protein
MFAIQLMSGINLAIGPPTLKLRWAVGGAVAVRIWHPQRPSSGGRMGRGHTGRRRSLLGEVGHASLQQRRCISVRGPQAEPHGPREAQVQRLVGGQRVEGRGRGQRGARAAGGVRRGRRVSLGGRALARAGRRAQERGKEIGPGRGRRQLQIQAKEARPSKVARLSLGAE